MQALYRQGKFSARQFFTHERYTRIAIGGSTLLRLATDISYLFYRLMSLCDGVRTGRLWQVAVSLSKIFTVASALLLRMLYAENALCHLALTGISILTDAGNLAKTEKWI